jgi:hypothetical protein
MPTTPLSAPGASRSPEPFCAAYGTSSPGRHVIYGYVSETAETLIGISRQHHQYRVAIG